MPKRHADSTQDENPPKRRQLSGDGVLVEAARKGDTTAVRAVLEKLPDAVHEACKGNHDGCLALLLPYVETTQVGFGILLSECVHANHVACTEVLLQHWKSVCKNKAFVSNESEHVEDQCRACPTRVCPAMWSDPAVCRVLIDAGADIETKDERGCSPLHRASDSGALDVVKMLVEAGAGVRATDNEGATCLMLAAYFGHTETVRYLVGLPEVEVNPRESDGDTALHYAARQDEADVVGVVRVLIDAGAGIDTVDRYGLSPLLWASESGARNVVKMLVEAGAGVRATDDEGRMCLGIAVCFGHTETVRYLVGLPWVELNHQNCKRETALHCAARNYFAVGDVAGIVQVLIDAGADIDTADEKERSPLHCACESGALDVVKMLVRAGAGVRVTDNEGDTCLTLAANVTSNYIGHTETVRYLVGLPEVEVNHQNVENNCALHYAVTNKHADVVQVLIDAGADIGTRNGRGHLPLHDACELGALDIVKILVEAGAGVRGAGETRRRSTYLTLAAFHGYTETVRYLLALPDVELNGRDGDGETALHCAVHFNYADTVQLLIAAGADIDTRNYNDQSPLDCANDSGASDIVEMLVEAGAVEESQSSYTPSVG